MLDSSTKQPASSSAAARACSAMAGGKCIDLVWAAIDGASGVADPAFEAHDGPIKYWATAFWECWFSVPLLTEAIERAMEKLKVTRKSIWGRVTGPATALVASFKRLRCTWTDPYTIIDDVGRTFICGTRSAEGFLHSSPRVG